MRTARQGILTLVEIGRHLEAIQLAFRSINATAVVDDNRALAELGEARRHARALVRELERFSLEE